ncbi:hypothetical protein Bca101_016460 [Brassica carinata]
MKSDDETAKLASTDEETRVQDEEDTSMEEESESDTDSGRAWSVEVEDDEEVVKPPNYLNMQDPEPEWDVDSYDGYECVFDADGREGFPNDEEYEDFRAYKIKAWKNRGFLEDPFRSVYSIINLDDLWLTTTKRQYLADIASLCVEKLNEEKGLSVEVVSIVRGNIKAGGGWKLYITFMAREHPDGPLMEYQAKAMDFAGGKKPPFPILCRPASSMP